MPDAPVDLVATGRAIAQAQQCLDEAQKQLNQHRYDNAVALAECAVTWIKAALPDDRRCYGNCPASGIDDVTPVMPPPEVITGDPSTCRHVVMDEMVGARWGFEDCLSCGKRFPARDEEL